MLLCQTSPHTQKVPHNFHLCKGVIWWCAALFLDRACTHAELRLDCQWFLTDHRIPAWGEGDLSCQGYVCVSVCVTEGGVTRKS